jgi:hypothetical protein
LVFLLRMVEEFQEPAHRLVTGIGDDHRHNDARDSHPPACGFGSKACQCAPSSACRLRTYLSPRLLVHPNFSLLPKPGLPAAPCPGTAAPERCFGSGLVGGLTPR